MSDYINRDLAIEDLKHQKAENQKAGVMLAADEDAIIRWLQKFPASYGWIPIWASLPEVGEEVHMTVRRDDGVLDTTLGWLDERGDWFCEDFEYVDVEVLSWMPFPVPDRVEV